jgi:hypothetical protein
MYTQHLRKQEMTYKIFSMKNDTRSPTIDSQKIFNNTPKTSAAARHKRLSTILRQKKKRQLAPA